MGQWFLCQVTGEAGADCPIWSSISATSRTENFRCTPKTGLCPTAWWWWWHQVTNPPCKAGPPSKTGLHPASCRTSFSPAAFNKGKNSENTRNANCLVKKNIGEHKALNKDTNICSFFQRMLSTHNYLSQWESAGATILWKAGQWLTPQQKSMCLAFLKTLQLPNPPVTVILLI